MAAALVACAPTVHAAISWNGEGESNWWFDPQNWSRFNDEGGPFLPPSQGQPVIATDTQNNIGTGTWDITGEGVVYDPDNDPFFADAGNYAYADGFGPQIINQLYISRNVPFASDGSLTDFDGHNLVTIKGDLTSLANVIVGRSGSGEDPENPGQYLQNLGRINQVGGAFRITNNVLDMGQREPSGWGNGIYDYRGGILEVSLIGGNGIRLSAGGSAGPGGHGRFIMRNPDSGGYVRAWDFNIAANAGQPGNLADGVLTGVGIVEFHFENGGTRPIQVDRNLIINNGEVTSGTVEGALRSSRLELVLSEAPPVDENGVPLDLGLFDVDFQFDPLNLPPSQGGFKPDGAISGAGTMGGQFSNADGSILYDQGAIVSAMFGGSTYNWTISYTGEITWSDPDNSVVDSISGTGGVDVVLIGHSSVIVPGLTGDFNNDGTVDAADYTVWRDGLGTEFDAEHYNEWKANFGATANGSGAVAALGASAVPEPGSVSLALVALAGLLALRRRVG